MVVTAKADLRHIEPIHKNAGRTNYPAGVFYEFELSSVDGALMHPDK